MYVYKILLHKDQESDFMITVPTLPDCITHGSDVEEPIIMTKEAIELYLEEPQERGKLFPMTATP
jgi:predicted RNase H-like HicB family nuclease